MGTRVSIDGPGDDPAEIWIECYECGGDGSVSVTDEANVEAGVEGVYVVQAECPVCGGLGCYEGVADDVDD